MSLDGTSALSWGEFARLEPELAGFVAERLVGPPAYLATIRKSGSPRVHPVTPILTGTGLFLFMEPTSPKGRDLRERSWFALHNGVPDNAGTGGEAQVTGVGVGVDDAGAWATVAEAASYTPAERYVLFELLVGEVRCHAYGDVELPPARRWTAPLRHAPVTEL